MARQRPAVSGNARVGRATARSVRHALDECARHGGYFVVGAAPHTGTGRLRDLYTPGDGDPMRSLVDAFARRLGTEERRVAASILVQGAVARLASPMIGCLDATSTVPDLDSATTWWRSTENAAFEILAEPAAGWEIRAQRSRPWVLDAADTVGAALVEGHIRPLVLAARRVVAVADGLLWGNAASALVGTMIVLRHNGLANPLTGEVVRRLLTAPPLADTGRFERPGDFGSFRRRNCCLYYRVPGGGFCADCGITERG